ALAADGKPLGVAEVRYSRGLVWVQPVKEAASYRLALTDAPKPALSCDRADVTPGETVTIKGPRAITWQVPLDARPGSHLWHQVGGAWIDFFVVPAAQVAVTLQGQTVSVAVTSALPSAAEATVSFMGGDQVVRLVPGTTTVTKFGLPAPSVERIQPAPLRLRIGALVIEHEYSLKTLLDYLPGPSLAGDFAAGYCFRGAKEDRDSARLAATGGQVSPRESVSCGGELVRGADELMFFMHPPYQGGVGYSFALLPPVALPADTPQSLQAVVGKADGSDLGDGIWYYVAVVEPDGKETRVASANVTRHEWRPIEANLAPWAGRTVRLKLITDVGPNDNSSGDWGAWGRTRLRSSVRAARHQLAESLADATASSPLPLPGLRAADLKGIRSAVVHVEAGGLDSGNQYTVVGLLNGRELGRMPATSGAAGDKYWAPGVIAVPAEALVGIGPRSVFALRNDGQDYYKVRRAWLEVTLADGRRAGSRIATATFTQPPGWQEQEGITVPFGEMISFELWFDLAT
ncbi:MAG: hypothetical protein HZB16_17740, partial [Armatimonadetes bacterium]|nr:hypothetical protein [Armatimonadota bacterium]